MDEKSTLSEFLNNQYIKRNIKRTGGCIGCGKCCDGNVKNYAIKNDTVVLTDRAEFGCKHYDVSTKKCLTYCDRKEWCTLFPYLPENLFEGCGYKFESLEPKNDNKNLRVSIFTPTNNPKFLLELYESIKEQDFYEWVIVANNVDVIKFDERVKIFRLDDVHYIGALKRYACTMCCGDILVEVDHDDLLAPDAIEEIKKAFENPEIGFVYSNSANFKNNFEATVPHRRDYGWKCREVEFKGYKLFEQIAFSATPSTVSKIWCAPNHVRAWRKTVYDEVGGHNPEMRVLDDGELIMRTYLKTKMKHVDKCLYFYRIRTDSENSWLIHNKEIQDGVYPLYDRYIYKLVSRWADLNSYRKVDLGGRFDAPKGYESVDLKNADIIADLNSKWPFEDNSVGVIRAHDIIEHLKNPIHVMEEAYRILKPGGYFMILVPSTDGRGAFQDPTHISFFNENSFWYYTRRTQNKYINCNVRFQAIRLVTAYPSQYHAQNKISYVYCQLVALKGQETYGEVLI